MTKTIFSKCWYLLNRPVHVPAGILKALLLKDSQPSEDSGDETEPAGHLLCLQMHHKPSKVQFANAMDGFQVYLALRKSGSHSK